MAEAAGGGRWRLIAGFVLLAAVMALALVAWFGFRGEETQTASAGGGAVPIVRAPDGPDRERPEDPGGVDVPDRDKQVYDTFRSGEEGGEPVVERLLPAAEAPLNDPEPAPEPQPEPETGTAAEESDVADAPESAEGGETVTETETEAEAGAETEALPEQEVASRPAPPPARPSELERKPSPVPEPAATAPAVSAAAPAPDGPWQVQLAAFREEADALATWKRISRKHQSLLGDMSPVVKRADTSNGVFYRLRVGGFDTREAANAFCGRLKAAGQDCISARR